MEQSRPYKTLSPAIKEELQLSDCFFMKAKTADIEKREPDSPRRKFIQRKFAKEF